MNGISCPKCGAVNPPNSAFCATCGSPLPQQAAPPPTPEQSQSGGWQPVQQPPPAPQSGWQQIPPPPGSQPPPPVYPQQYPGQKITSDSTKWALGLGIAALLCCGPFTAIPGFFMAKKDMDEIAAGRAPHLNEGTTKAAYYLNIVALALFVLGLCFWLGIGGLHRF